MELCSRQSLFTRNNTQEVRILKAAHVHYYYVGSGPSKVKEVSTSQKNMQV